MLPKIDDQVFKLKDDRVQSLLSGKLTVTEFVYTLMPVDYIIFTGEVVYALTQTQYYALCTPIYYETRMSETIFKQLLSDLSWAAQSQMPVLKLIQENQNACTVCQYKRYVSQVLGIALKHKDIVRKYNLKEHEVQLKPYPATTDRIQAKVTEQIPSLFTDLDYNRKPCFDCVRKHIGQAYIKGHEAQHGYTEHFALAVANLAQAYQECPAQAKGLRNLLLFCIAKSQKQHVMFIPLHNILLMLDSYIMQTDPANTAMDTNKPSEQLVIQLTEEDKTELSNISEYNRIQIKINLVKAMKLAQTEGTDDSDYDKTLWAGYLANAADTVADFSKGTADVLRNRRLLFKEMPSACLNSQYDNQDIIKAMYSSSQSQTDLKQQVPDSAD